MGPTTESEFDYVEHIRSQAPDRAGMSRGPEERSARHARPGKERVTIRLDSVIVEAFKELTGEPGGKGYQTLVNQALRDWLMARGVHELMREEIRRVLREELARPEAQPANQ